MAEDGAHLMVIGEVVPRPPEALIQLNVVGVEDGVGRSALLRRLRHETTELRHDLRALTLRAIYFTLLPLRDGHDQFEGLLALLAHELIARHGTSLVLD
jgi:hypothetical protein